MEYRDQFRIPPVFLIVLGISLTTTLTIIISVGWADLAAFFASRPSEEGPTMFWVLLSVIALEAGVTAMIMSWCRLRISARGIGVIYRPFVWRWKWRSWEAVQAIYLAKASPIGDFGGWGLRIGSFGPYKRVHAYAFDEGTYAFFELQEGRIVAVQITRLQEFQALVATYAPAVQIQDPNSLLPV
ncbi:MAG: hypothetical protein P8N56_00275 [Schleiferiaceae bacterium]|nr:hypothetical protein [Schleiferiaceae bacterium]